MSVRVNQARNNRRAGEVDDTGRLTLELERLWCAADEHDLAVFRCHGVGVGLPTRVGARRVGRDRAVSAGLAPVQRVDAGIGQDQVGRLCLGDGLRTAGHEHGQQWCC